MKRKILAFMLCLVMCVSALAGCGSSSDAVDSTEEAENDVEETGGSTEEAEIVAVEEDNNTSAESGEDSLRTVYPLTIEVYDTDGSTVSVTFESAPERVVSTQLSITEFLIDLGLKDKIVGIMDNDNAVDDELAAELADLTSLGYKSSISKEAILAVDPDLVMGKATSMFTDTAIGTLSDYLDMGINVYTQVASASIDQSLDNIIQDIRNIGMIFDIQETANAYADELQAKLDEVIETVEAAGYDGEPYTVLIMAGYQDGTFVAFRSEFNELMLETVNATNVLDQGGSGFTLENLIAMNPDAIIYVNADRYAEADVDAVERLLSDETLKGVTAIENEMILEIAYDDIMDFGARDIDTLITLADFFYGE